MPQPPQLVEEADAIQLWNLLPDAPEDEKPQMAAIIRRYEEQEKSAGRTPYAGYHQAQVNHAQSVRRLFTDKLHGMKQPQYDDFQAKLIGTRDPDRVKFDIFNSEFLAPQYGHRPQDIDGRLPHLMQDYAQKRWGSTMPLSGGQFFKMVQADYALADKQNTASLNSAVSGRPTPEAWSEFKAANEKDPTWNPARERDRAKQFYLTTHDLSVKSEALRSVADQVEATLSASDDYENIRQIVPLFSSLSNFEAGIVMTMLEHRAKGGEDKGLGEQTGETAYRTIRDVWRGSVQFYDEAGIQHAVSKISKVAVPIEEIEKGPASILRYLQHYEPYLGSFDQMVDAAMDDRPKQLLSEAQQKSVELEARRRVDERNQINRLQDIHDQVMDPVRASNWFTEEYYYPAIRAGSMMVNSMVPGGILLSFGYYAKGEKDRLIGLGVGKDIAEKQGAVVGLAQAFLDKAEGGVLLGKFALTRRFLKTPATNAAGYAGRFAVNWGFNVAAETGLDVTQEYIVPALIQDLTQQGGDVAWLGPNGVMAKTVDAIPDTAAPMMLLGLIGATSSGISDFQQARTLLQNEHLLTAYIENPAFVTEIRTLAQKGEYSAAAAKFREYAAPALRKGVTLSDAGKKALQTFAQESARQQTSVSQLVSDGTIPDVQRTDDAWRLRYRDGRTADFDNYEDADAVRWQAPQAQALRIHESVRETLRNAERNLAPGTGIRADFTNEHVTTDRRIESLPESERAEAQRRFEQRSKIESTFMDDGKAEQQEHATATALNAATAPDAQAERAVMTILGESSNEYVDGIYTNVVKLNLGHTPLTVTEETLESDAKKLLSRGQRALILEGLRDTEAKTGQKWLRTKDDRKLEDQDLIEGYSNLGVAMFVGEAQAGHERGKANRRWLNSYQRSLVRQTALGRLLDAFALKMAAVFRRAAAVMELRGKGEFHKGLETELARGLGLEHRQHEAGVVQEAHGIAESIGGRTYSVLPSSDDSGGMEREAGAHRSDAGNHRDRPPGDGADLFESTARELGGGQIGRPRGLEDGPALKREFDRQVAELEKRAVEPPDEEFPHVESGGEHAVYKAGNQAQKLTLPGLYGYVADENDMFMNREAKNGWGGIELRPALPSEYMMRWSLMKRIFGIPADFKRIEENEEGPLVVIRQPWIEGGVPGDPEITAYMQAKGFRRVDDKYVRQRDQQGLIWYRDSDHILAADVRPRNFKKTDSGHLIPIDLMLSVHPQEDFFTFSLTAGELPARLAKLFDPFQRNPELRQKVGMVAQQRMSEHAEEFGEIVSASRTLVSIERERLKRRDAQYADLKGAGATDAEAKKISERDSKEWAQRRENDIPSYQEKLRPAIKMLDAILSAFPPEVRGKVGGYSGVADRKTPEAMLKFIEGRVAKMDKELEKWLSKDADEQFKKLLVRAQPKKDEAGKKRVGKIGSDTHALFDVLKQAMEWTMDEANAHIAGLETSVAGGNLTAEQEAHALLEASLVAQVADWDNADAARKIEALKNAKYALEKGYAEYRLKKLMQEEDRQIRRQQLKTETGKAGTAQERDDRALAENGWKQSLERFTISLLNFDQALRWVFGDSSAEAQRLSEMERAAANAKDDSLQMRQQAIEDLFTQLAGGDKYKGERRRWDMSQKTLNVQGRKLSELEAITATMMWMQEDGQRHMIGKLDENGKVISPWHYDQAFVDEIENALSAEAKAVRAHLLREYGGEYARLNPVYRELNGINLPSHKNYSPLTVKPMKATTGMVTDPVTGALTSATSMTPGSLRTRGTAIAEPDFRDALQTFIAHTAQIEHWIAYSPFVAEAQSILANRELGNSVEAAAGKEAVQVIRDWVDVFASGGTRDAANHLAFNQWAEKVTNRAAAMALIGRIGTLAVQSTQLTAAMAEMPTGAYAIRLGKLLTGNLGWKAALDSAYIQRRLNQMPPIVRQGMEGLRANKPNQLKHQVAKLGTLISGADALFTAGTFAIVHDYQMTQLKKAGITGTQAEAMALQTAERITDALAQPTRLGTRSLHENRTTGVGWRLAWNFASDARKNLALMIYNSAKRPWPQKVRTIATVWFIGSAMATLIRTAWRDARDDDDEDVFDERHWNPVRLALATLTGPLQGIPLVGDMTEEFTYALTGEYLPSGGLLSQGKDAATAIRRAPDYLAGDEDLETALKDAESLMMAVGLFNDTMAAGSSVMHLIRDAFGLGQNVEGED